MNHILGLLVGILVFVWAQPLQAHGEENQGDPKKENPVIQAEFEAQPSAQIMERPDAQHERTDRSIWTSLHPATVHFPIALLLGAALAELIGTARPSEKLAAAVTVMTWGGAAGAAVAAIFGWIHTGFWLGGDATMDWHRWLGTGLAIAATVAALLERRADRRPFLLLLIVIAAALPLQAYWGGELAHGPNHLGL